MPSTEFPLNRIARTSLAALLLTAASAGFGAPAQPAPEATNIFAQALSRAAAVDTALRHNTAILKGKRDLEAAHGIVMQLRSIVFPTLLSQGAYNAEDRSLIQQFPLPAPFNSFIVFPDRNWNADIKVQQSIYEGGRMTSALRSAKLTKQQALLNYQTLLADTLLSVRVAYDDVLLAQQQIDVEEASVKLLSHELDDVRRRYKAGTVPQFDVLRADVELANEKPKLIQARNSFRISKNNLLNLLGCNLPKTMLEDVPLELSDSLVAVPVTWDLPASLVRALAKRPELAALQKAAALRHEDLVQARSGFKPSAQIFGGYQWQSLPYGTDQGQDLSGWVAGAQLSWNIFDFGLTRGKITESKARFDQAELDVDESQRQIELDVRTAYSNFIEAREVLESQKTVQEEAEESLRLAEARMAAGSSTELDVLTAQTDLTQARTTQVQALHDYSVARARLQRAMGDDMEIVPQ
jgi:outer membrane protein TolC